MIEGIRPDADFTSIIDRSDLLGEGRTREVFGVIGEPNWVIKENKTAFGHDNMVEWIVWHALVAMADPLTMGNNPNTTLKDRFAACIAISESSKYLAMERLAPPPTGATYHGFPDWLNDRKPQNLGVSKGIVKACDYSMIKLYHVLNPHNWTLVPFP